KILQIIELWMQKASINLISYILRINKKAIKKLITRISEIIVPRYYNLLDKIGGDNMIVEIDESKFGKRKYHRGHHVEGVWILGLVERSAKKRIILFRVKNRSKITLENLIKKNSNKHINNTYRLLEGIFWIERIF
ncbi:hypothetical protein NGRA_3565, partial [Nosema granulosis]